MHRIHRQERFAPLPVVCETRVVARLSGVARLVKRRWWLAFATLVLWTQGHAAEPAHEEHARWYVPSSMYVQSGVSENAYAAAVGATWDWPWRHATPAGAFTGYLESSVGVWSSKHSEPGQDWSMHVGLTPVLRLHPKAFAPGWFLEAGLGANLIAPTYRAGEKRFSTAFNFGSHVGVGFRFGARRKSELLVRVQHFSNAGLKHPNPGENFIQVRYAHHF